MHVPYATLKAAIPLLAEYELSPAKLAPTPDGYVPGKIPDRLTSALVATPLLLVVALPHRIAVQSEVDGLAADG